jgi:hypothetical protein
LIHRNFQRFAVRLGEHRISTEVDCLDTNEIDTCNPDKPQFQDIDIKSTKVHENYSRYQLNFDIALLFLKTEVVFKGIKNIKTICLPVEPYQTIEQINEENKGKPVMMIVAGWGRTENGSNSDVLLHAKIPYVKSEDCVMIYQNFYANKSLIQKNFTLEEHQLVKTFSFDLQ